MLRTLLLITFALLIGLTVEQPFEAAKKEEPNREDSNIEKSIIEESDEEEVNLQEGGGANHQSNQNPSQETIYIYSKKDNSLIDFPRYVEKLSSFIRQKQENGEEGTKGNPIKVEWSSDVLHRVVSVIKKLPSTARNQYARNVEPQDYTDQTIFVYEWLSEGCSELCKSLEYKELEELYFAILELDIAPLVNVLAEEMVKRMPSEEELVDAFIRYDAKKTLAEGYILIQLNLLRKGKEYRSIADNLGQYGQSGDVEKLYKVNTSLKGIGLIENIKHSININKHYEGPGVDPDFPMEPFRKFSNLHTVCIDGVDWLSIPETFLNGLDQLQVLELKNTRFTTLPGGLVHNLQNLRKFTLCRSLVDSLPEGFLMGLSKLREVAIKGCSNLQTWPSTFFSNVVHLENFTLSDCPKLKTWPSTFLAGVGHLENFTLSGCPKLQTLPNTFFQHHKDIKVIEIVNDSNHFYLPDDLFQGLTGLQKLILDETRIQQCPNVRGCRSLDQIFLPSTIRSATGLRKIRRQLPYRTRIYIHRPPGFHHVYNSPFYTCNVTDYMIPYRFGRVLWDDFHYYTGGFFK